MTGKQNKPSSDFIALYITGLILFCAGLAEFHYFFRWSGVLVVFLAVVFLAGHAVRVYTAHARRSAAVRVEREALTEEINLLQADIARIRLGLESGGRKIKDFTKLRFLAEQLSRSFSLMQTAKTFAVEVYRFFDKVNVRVFVYLFHPQTGRLTLAASEGIHPRRPGDKTEADVFDAWVIKTHQSLLAADVLSDYRFQTAGGPAQAASLIAVPLRTSHQLFGILRLESDQAGFFDTNDLRLFDTAGDLGAVAVENARFYEQLLDIAVKDGLTGLYLRRQFLTNLETELAKRVYLTTGLSLIMLDLDHFKTYNDTYGHMAGDIILKWIGRLLSDICKDRGLTACRWGGEEFCVMAPHSREAMAVEIAEKIRRQTAAHEFQIRRQTFRVTVSAGAASFPQTAKIQEDLIRLADQAMYLAKRRGRDRVCAASEI